MATHLQALLCEQLAPVPEPEAVEGVGGAEAVERDSGKFLDLAGVNKLMQYMESLLENFPQGEAGLGFQLPLGMYAAITL